MTTDSEVAMRRASLLPAAFFVALIGACDGGAPAEPKPAAPVVVTSVDTLTTTCAVCVSRRAMRTTC